MRLANMRPIHLWFKSTSLSIALGGFSTVAFAWQDSVILPEAPTTPPNSAVIVTSDDAKTTSILESTTVSPANQESVAMEEVEGATPLMQGPINEAFAERFDLDDEEPLVIDRQPPQPIDEQPPEYRPEGDNIEWIPGYWGWDIANEDFVWVSGVWRQVPPGQQWVPGYWTQSENGWRWVSGFWTATANPQIVYLPTPPASIENGPSSPAPGPNYFWCPGYWMYGSTGSYVWSSGHWRPCKNNWVWIPARYVWTPSGCVYRAGYWDYDVCDRGMLFAPIAFGPGFNHRYRPSYVIETSPLLLANLYVAPGASCYYFGSCYANSHRRCYPWVSYYNHGYDPLFSYYAYQPSQRMWLRNVTSLQNQYALANHSQRRWTVADHLQHHQAGSLGFQAGIGPGSNDPQQLGGLNALMHVAPLAALAFSANNRNVDFKTPFAVKQTSVQNNFVKTQQLNELANKRRDLERATSVTLPLGKDSIGNSANSGNSDQPQMLKQIELVKSSRRGPIPVDLKVGTVHSRAFSQSIGVQPALNSGNHPGSNAGNLPGATTNNNSIGSNVAGNNSGGNNARGNDPDKGSSVGANGPSAKAGRSKRSSIQAQQFSQLFGGENTSAVDSKSLESLRNKTVGAANGQSHSSNSASGSTALGSTPLNASTPANNSKVAPPLPKNFPNLNNRPTGSLSVNPLGGSQPNVIGEPTGSSKPGKGSNPGQGSNQVGNGNAGPGNAGPILGGTILGGSNPNNPTITNNPMPLRPGKTSDRIGGAFGAGPMAGGNTGAGVGNPSRTTPLGSGSILGGSPTQGNRSAGNRVGGVNPGNGSPGPTMPGVSGPGNFGIGGNRPGNAGTVGGVGRDIGGGGPGGNANLGSGNPMRGGSPNGALRSGGNQGGKLNINGSRIPGSGNSGSKNSGKKSKD